MIDVDRTTTIYLIIDNENTKIHCSLRNYTYVYYINLCCPFDLFSENGRCCFALGI